MHPLLLLAASTQGYGGPREQPHTHSTRSWSGTRDWSGTSANVPPCSGWDGNKSKCPYGGLLARPRVLVMPGCSGSTYVQKTARELLRRHGYTVAPAAFEICNPKTNAKYTKSKGMGQALHEMHRAFTKRQQTMVFKCDMKDSKTRTALKNMGAHFVFAHRSNILDYMTCLVRDCFVTTPLGTPVDASGQPSALCFNRRTKMVASKESPTFANLNITDLAKRLVSFNAKSLLSSAQLATSGRKKHVPTFTMEALAAYQFNSSSGVADSLKAWTDLLKGWSVKPNATTIRNFLTKNAVSRPPPAPHSKTIYNIAQVSDYLRTHPDVEWMLRKGSAV